MTDKTKNVRISDIARMAGVSVGTVDRILHNRGKVSKTAQEKVNRVLQEVEYRPNLMARSLALKKQFNIAALIPAFRPGEYWEKAAEGIDKAAGELNDYNIVVQKIFFDQYDQTSFKQFCGNISSVIRIGPEICQLIVFGDVGIDIYVWYLFFIEAGREFGYRV